MVSIIYENGIHGVIFFFFYRKIAVIEVRNIITNTCKTCVKFTL